MMRILMLLLIVTLAAACDESTEPADSPTATPSATQTMAATASSAQMTATDIVAQATRVTNTPASANSDATLAPGDEIATQIVREATQGALTPDTVVSTCVPGMTSRTLDNLAEEVRTALEAQSLKLSFVSIFATETTQDCQTITRMQTTYRIGLSLSDIPDETQVGDIAAQVLQTMRGFTAPQGQAQIELAFQVFSSGRNIWERWLMADYAQAIDASSQSGADLVRILGGLQDG